MWAQPYHLTLLAYLGLMDAKRIEGFEREALGLQSGRIVYEAILDQKRFQQREREFQSRLQRGVGIASEKPDPEALVAEMLALGARLKPPPVS